MRGARGAVGLVIILSGICVSATKELPCDRLKHLHLPAHAGKDLIQRL